MNRSRIAALSFVASLALGAGMTGSASANYHLNMVTEVHQGTGVSAGDYVELQAFSPGQQFVGGHYVATYDGGGGLLTQVLLSNVPSGADQATILVANSNVVPGADIYNPVLNVVNTGGYVCFTETAVSTGVDCVAYGNVAGTPSTSPSGIPAGPALGLSDGQSLSRSLTKGCPTLLDTADDTNNSAADFAIAAPTPRGNAVAPTEVVCPPVVTAGPIPIDNPSPAKKPKCKKAKKKKKGKSAAAAACKKKKKKK